MKTKGKIGSYGLHVIAASMLLLTAQLSLAASATWLSSPQDSTWENANNWTPGGPPNGPSDVATFGQSSQTEINVSASVEVNSIVFTSGASSFNIAVSQSPLGVGGQLTFSGTGVVDNSSVSQACPSVFQMR